VTTALAGGPEPGQGAPVEAGRPLISIVSPCFNEVLVVGLFHRALSAVLTEIGDCDFEIVFVDDGSTDDTLSALNGIAAEDPRVRVCSLSRNFGHQIALTAGLDHAAGDAVVMTDCDLQHPPSLVPRMIERWREGYDIVSALRERTAGVSLFKRASSRAFYLLINAVGAADLPNGAADFCLVSRRVADALRSMPERHRFLRGMIAWTGFRRAFLPYRAAARAAGETKYTLVKMVTMGLDAIVSFSTAPLRLATRVGVLIVLGGFAYLAWNLVYAFLAGWRAPGWASVLGVVMILGGAQIMFTGLIGQYLARVFEEAKGRPLYLLKQAPKSPARPVTTR
jgi:dolichol-phosphate mannosyltransferase